MTLSNKQSKTATNSKKKSDGTNSEFVQYSLSIDEKAQVKAAVFDDTAVSDALQELVEAGYKVTFRYDTYSMCHACWIIAPLEDNDNAGLILSGRGSTAPKALKQVCWQHFTLFHEIWPRVPGTTDRMIDD